jgi:serine/threonine protein kinase
MSKDLEYHYKKLEKLGEGTFSNVYKGLDTRSGEFVALKQIKIRKADDGLP